jgi:hypothetical protein
MIGRQRVKRGVVAQSACVALVLEQHACGIHKNSLEGRNMRRAS